MSSYHLIPLKFVINEFKFDDLVYNRVLSRLIREVESYVDLIKRRGSMIYLLWSLSNESDPYLSSYKSERTEHYTVKNTSYTRYTPLR